MLKHPLRLLAIAILTLMLAACGKKTNPALLGTWEGKANNKTFSLTFHKDARLELGGDIAATGSIFTSLTLLTDFNVRPGLNTPITYKCINATQMEVSADFGAFLEKLSAGGTGKISPEVNKMLYPRETLTFAVAGHELTLTNEKGTTAKLQRVE